MCRNPHPTIKKYFIGHFWKKITFCKNVLHMQHMLHMRSTCVAYAKCVAYATYVAYAKYRCCICDICCICEAYVLCLRRLLHMWSALELSGWALWWWGGMQGLCRGAVGCSGGVGIWISILQVFFFKFPLSTHQTTPHFCDHWKILNSRQKSIARPYAICRYSTREMTLF